LIDSRHLRENVDNGGGGSCEIVSVVDDEFVRKTVPHFSACDQKCTFTYDGTIG